ncbi:hypothetical protein [Candidatus Amarobacter glycogenicus]|uniref:hypothetical protein n=1 Tax=Candidatus Amarobacter glycogenicus TaxID=3140699 RepID=UPI0031CCAB02
MSPSCVSRFISSIASEGPSAISRASAVARLASSSAGTTSLTRPILRASVASMILPVYISFRAFSTPTSRGRNQVHPVSATMARFTKIALKRAASEATRMSQAIASEKPAPTLAPFTAAIVGFPQ